MALLLYFEGVCKVESATESRDALVSVNGLKHCTLKLYFLFLSYILAIINALNKEFQSEDPFSRWNENILLSLINFKIPENVVPHSELYLGSKVEIELKSMSVTSSEIEFKNKCLRFYVVQAKNIQNRYDFDNNNIKAYAKFEPKHSGKQPNAIPVLNNLPANFEINVQKTNTECYIYLANRDIETVWYVVGEIQN